MTPVVLVLPCYNEERRLVATPFLAALERHPGLQLVFVDDGSRDRTPDRLHELQAADPRRIRVRSLARNMGKGEAVRRGMLDAFALGPGLAGYWDADLSTPLAALSDFLAVMERRDDIDIVIGARVATLGREISRRPSRHYAGRVFATLASMTLELPVYDTQCGAKLFRVIPRLEGVFREPFLSRWVFDVEILARLLAEDPRAAARVYELCLREWRDVPGSRVRAIDFVVACRDLLRIRRRYLRRRLRPGDSPAHARRPS